MNFGEMRPIALFLSVVALAISHAQAQSAMTCDDAMKYHEFAVDQVATCAPSVLVPPPPVPGTIVPCAAPPPPLAPLEAPVPLTLCDLVFQGRYNPNATNYDQPLPVTNQISFLKNIGQPYEQNPIGYNADWANRLVQNTLTAPSDMGEVAYILQQVEGTWTGFQYYQNLTMENLYGTWASAWWAAAQNLLTYANDTTNNWDDMSRSNSYLKAANYLYAGNWPSPYGDEAILHATMAADAFTKGMDLRPQLSYVPVLVPFSNGTVSVELPGFLVTPDVSGQLPLVIITNGPGQTKEQTILQYGLPFLARGYAVMTVEGPGQGAVIKDPPNMPLYPNPQEILGVILDYINSTLTQYVKPDKVAFYGVAKGSYFVARACSGNSDRLAACIVNPPPETADTRLTQYYQPVFMQKWYMPLQYAVRYNASVLPANLSSGFMNATDIFDTMLNKCNASSGAPQLIAQAYEEPTGFTSWNDALISPDLIYIAGAYGGVVSDDEDTLYGGLWQAFNNMKAFGNYTISNITCPVIVITGDEEYPASGQDSTWFSQLSNDTQAKSVQINLGAPTGAALQSQAGSPIAGTAPLFAALNPIMGITSNASNATPYGPNQAAAPAASPAALPTLNASSPTALPTFSGTG